MNALLKNSLNERKRSILDSIPIFHSLTRVSSRLFWFFAEVPAEVPLRGPAAEGGQTLSVARWESGGERSDELNKPSDSAQL